MSGIGTPRLGLGRRRIHEGEEKQIYSYPRLNLKKKATAFNGARDGTSRHGCPRTTQMLPLRMPVDEGTPPLDLK
jgi:hypothetical protein